MLVGRIHLNQRPGRTTFPSTSTHAPETKDFVPASERRVRELTRARLVIVDEIGYERLGQAEATLLFGFVSQCAERTSLVVTSNKGFDEWGGFMGKDMRQSRLDKSSAGYPGWP